MWHRLVLILISASAVAACSMDGGGLGNPPSFDEPAGAKEEAALPVVPPPMPYSAPPDMQSALEHARESFKNLPAVAGLAHGRAADGRDALVVYVTDQSAITSLPAELEGYPVIIQEVPGGFHALMP